MGSDKYSWSGDGSLPKGNLAADDRKLRQDPMKKKSAEVTTFEAILGSKSAFNGTAHLSGNACIEGRFKGELVSDGELVIAESAEVEAAIQGTRVQVFGKVVGDIVCSDLLEIFTGAQVVGTIASPRLVIHDGVVFEGRCHMRSSLCDQVETEVTPAFASTERKVVELSSRDALKDQGKRTL